ncbi:hypothetical protein [Streptomyces broussonetiae]|uniref:Uncharacterized protein n=1 Tax=Streptomyces broussonetiae TaxID=2686304 RepID=A0A6I6MY35_9ACTN|nr:hypothetical protein [Streptomyces broussonetiae]QHA04242.1 hypothetical protein GQF42_13930 [Streptomyces broussonetiae]
MSGRTQRQEQHTGNSRRSGSAPRSLWGRAARSPWTVVCVVAAVVVGPAAETASALDRANAAPPLHIPSHEGPKSLA